MCVVTLRLVEYQAQTPRREKRLTLYAVTSVSGQVLTYVCGNCFFIGAADRRKI